jgi:hypothetical protein
MLGKARFWLGPLLLKLVALLCGKASSAHTCGPDRPRVLERPFLAIDVALNLSSIETTGLTGATGVADVGIRCAVHELARCETKRHFAAVARKSAIDASSVLGPLMRWPIPGVVFNSGSIGLPASTR